MRAFVFTIALCCASALHYGQVDPSSAPVAENPYVILDTLITDYYFSVWYTDHGDTMVKATHSPIEVAVRTGNRLKKVQYDKLQKKVIKTYPYAKAAGDVMRMYETLCSQITDEQQQKALLDRAEKTLMNQFEKDLRNMTISEGVILVKLIDRQTGATGYELLRSMKGKFSAFMWQSIARVFGQNLKDDYDMNGEDVWIENIVALIEDGTIPVADKTIDPFGVNSLVTSH
ncbi:MAG: DUF4294 domain-containing protein [Flavobacteriales bacterium]|jgi:hypothetical protein